MKFQVPRGSADLNSDQRRGKSESAVFQKTSDRRQQPWKLRGRQLLVCGPQAALRKLQFQPKKGPGRVPGPSGVPTGERGRGRPSLAGQCCRDCAVFQRPKEVV
jgi:hypothetical protein